MLHVSIRFAPRLLFAVALAAVLHEAIEPRHEAPFVLARDVIEHGLWAYGLTILGVAAFPRTRAVYIAAALLLLSALAEAAQVAVGRSAELSDWLGSAGGVLAALMPMSLLWVRERLLKGRASPGPRGG